MYREIEELLKDSAKINAMFEKPKENTQIDIIEPIYIKPDPRIEIEEGLDKVNYILQNVLNDKNTNCPLQELNKSNLSKYLSFPCTSANLYSSPCRKNAKEDSGTNDDIKQEKIIYESELDENFNELYPFLTSSKEFDESISFNSSPDKEFINLQPKDKLDYCEKENAKLISLKNNGDIVKSNVKFIHSYHHSCISLNLQ